MANKSSWNMSQDPTENYVVPPDSLRESTYISTANSGDSNEMTSNQEFLRASKHSFKDVLLASDNAVHPGNDEHFNKPKKLRIPLPHTPLESSLHNLVISGPATIQPPTDSQVTEEDIHDYEEMDEHSSTLKECIHKKANFGLPKIENPLLAFTHPKSKQATQKDTQDNVQEDQLSDESEGYVIEQINFKSPVTGKMDKPLDESEGYVIEQIDFELPVNGKGKSPFLNVTATSNKAIYNARSSEYYEWCEVTQLQKPAPVATATRLGAFVGNSSVHQISQLHDRGTKAHQSMDTNHTAALTGGKKYKEARNHVTEIKKSGIPKLECIDSSTSNYVHLYKVNNPAMKGDSHIYTYDYVHHSFVQMCKRRKRCTGVPPRTVKRTGYQPSTCASVTSIKEHKPYVNFEIIENHNITLPPRKNHRKPTPKRRANCKPPMPSRNIPRQGCYLSAPSALPKMT